MCQLATPTFSLSIYAVGHVGILSQKTTTTTTTPTFSYLGPPTNLLLHFLKPVSNLAMTCTYRLQILLWVHGSLAACVLGSPHSSGPPYGDWLYYLRTTFDSLFSRIQWASGLHENSPLQHANTYWCWRPTNGCYQHGPFQLHYGQ